MTVFSIFYLEGLIVIKKNYLLIMAVFFLALGTLIGCAGLSSTLGMTEEEQLAFAQDCLNNGLVADIRIDPLSDKVVSFECVPRFPGFVTPTPPTTGGTT